MTEDLIVTFGKGDGNTHDWTYKGLDPDLPVPKIKEACELLTKLDICTENGVKLFDSVVTAKVLTYKETLIFDPDHETKGITYYQTSVEETDEEPSCEEVRCFEVADEPSTSEQKKKVGLPETSPLDSITTPHGHYFKQLTTIDPAEKTKAAITVEKESLPQPKGAHIEQYDQKPVFDSGTDLELSDQSTKEGNVLLRWIYRRRKRNKEGPIEIPRE